MPEYKIIQIEPNSAEFHLFTEVLKHVYPNMPKLETPEKIASDHLHSCYVFTKDSIPVARAILYVNKELRHKGKSAGCIGYYESIEDLQASDKLINHIAETAKSLGLSYLIGPMNGSTWENYRWNVSYEHPPFLLEQHHPLYYNQQFAQSGFEPLMEYFSNLVSPIICDKENVLKREKEFREKGMVLRSIDRNNYEAELKKLFPFISSVFSHNYLYSPISWESFLKKYQQALPLINPEMVKIAEDESGKVVGFIFCYHDLLCADEKRLVIKTLAAENKREWWGLGSVLTNVVIKKAKENGFTSIIHAFIRESGDSVAISKNFEASKFKTYLLYIKKIQ